MQGISKKYDQKYRREWEIHYPWISRVAGDKFKAKCTICDEVFSISSGGGLVHARKHSASRKHKYRTEWEKEFPWVSPVEHDESKANCTLCDRVFSISQCGLGDVGTHLYTRGHTTKALVEQEEQQSGIDPPITDGDENKRKRKNFSNSFEGDSPERNRRYLQSSTSVSTSSSKTIKVENSSHPEESSIRIHMDLDDSDEKPTTPLLQLNIEPDQNSLAKSVRLQPTQPASDVHNSVVDINVRRKQRPSLVIPNHQQSVMSNLSSFWKAGRLCDAYISNGNVDIKVHKMIFAAVCPDILDIFINTPRHRFPRVTFPNSVSKEALVAFAEYMYNGVLDLDPDLLVQMKIIAQHLHMEAFEKLCNNKLKSLLPQNIPPTSVEPILSDACSLSGLIEEAPLEYNQTPVMEMVPPSNKTHQKNKFSVNSSSADGTLNVTLSNVSAETDYNLIRVVDNSHTSSDNTIFDITMTSTPLIKVERVDQEDHEYGSGVDYSLSDDRTCDMTSTPLIKVERVDPEDQQYGREAVSLGEDYSLSDSIFSNTNLSQSRSSSATISHHTSYAHNESLNMDDIWTQNNNDEGNIDVIANPTQPHPVALFMANVPSHTQD